MGRISDYKPAMAMVGMQFTYAGLALSTRAVLLQGMSPRVFVVYRQAVATLVVAPIAYFSRGESSKASLGLRSFCLIFLASLIGVVINQNFYFEGLYFASSSMGSAMANLVPAITFILACFFGLENVDIQSLRSIAKIVGTLVCVSGAISMTLLKGPQLFNTELHPFVGKSLFTSSGGETWLLGCIFLFASTCSWSFWLILQVPVSASYPDHLSLSAWMCFFATLQSATLALFVDRDVEAWKLHSDLEIYCCLLSGIIGSGLSFFVQAWCISKRGPLFSAMFSPLCTVMVTILAAIILHEEIYTGSIVGGIGVILGLYVVLWGKAKDIVQEAEETDPKSQNVNQAHVQSVKILIDGSPEKTASEFNLKEPLLNDKTTDINKVII